MFATRQCADEKRLHLNIDYSYKKQKIRHLPIKTHPHGILRVPTTQLAKMSIDLKFVKLTADVLEN